MDMKYELYIYNLINSSANPGRQFNMNCTNFTVEEWKSLNLTRSIAATLGVAMTFAILLFLMYYKAYSSLFQRLYLYLIIATLLNEIVGVISVDHQVYYRGQEKVCIWVGFFTGWSYVLLFIFSYEIIVYLLFLVVSKIRGFQISQCGMSCTRYFSVIVEVVYIVLPLLIATAFSMPPYKQQVYGIAGPWCFVRSLSDDCEAIGKLFQLTFYGMYLALGVAGIVATLIFSVVYFKLSASFREVRHLLKRTLYVLVFKFIHIILIMCSAACRVYTLWSRQHKYYFLWLSHALAVPLGVLVFPLGYFLCFHPVGKIAQILYRKITHKCCKHKMSFDYDEEQNTTLHATAPRSNRISQPSSTFFFVPHPDELSERSTRISDTGYGSTSQSHYSGKTM